MNQVIIQNTTVCQNYYSKPRPRQKDGTQFRNVKQTYVVLFIIKLAML